MALSPNERSVQGIFGFCIDYQEILKALLIDTYEVVSAFTGTEALDILGTQHETISLILLDLNLPDIHGLDVLRKIKDAPVLTKLSVIVMTADSEAEVESLSLGAIDFIPKPYPQQKVILARILRTIEPSEDRDILRWTERDHLTGLYTGVAPICAQETESENERGIAVSALEEKIGDPDAGVVVTFGSYEQDNNPENGPEPIEWEVLEVKDGKILLLSRVQ